ncbi:unnamed protein product [Gongylonema pulchrum]|uniref:HORMA domain-containing protein n=1 Tax=Gongylonema pulchrum TaxID=637853 RepID=A0A3P7P398_9BILA|nr:unnamed protein product [Gongylonema pulchrum]
MAIHIIRPNTQMGQKTIGYFSKVMDSVEMKYLRHFKIHLINKRDKQQVLETYQFTIKYEEDAQANSECDQTSEISFEGEIQARKQFLDLMSSIKTETVALSPLPVPVSYVFSLDYCRRTPVNFHLEDFVEGVFPDPIPMGSHRYLGKFECEKHMYVSHFFVCLENNLRVRLFHALVLEFRLFLLICLHVFLSY